MSENKTNELSLGEVEPLLCEFYHKNKEGKGGGYAKRLIQEFCNQEKRSTAIAFAEWRSDRIAVGLYGKTDDEIYDLFLSEK